jgi:hypothetical protein
MGELLRELAADLVGVLINSSLVREIALPEERPMSLLAGLLPGVSLELQWMVRGEGTEGRLRGDFRGVMWMGLDGVKVLEIGIIPSRIESSFLGVNDNFMATLDGVLTGVLKLRLCLDGVRNGD